MTLDLLTLGLFATTTSLLTAVAGLGGGMLLLALMAQLFPPLVLIPLHGIAQFFSNTNRGVIHRRSLEWAYLRPFVLGSTVGAFAFVPLVVFVNPGIGAISVGLFILLVTWFPNRLNVSKLPYFLSGALTSGLGVLFGATGPLAMSAHPKANWSKDQIVGNHGAAMGFQHGIKVVAFLVAGTQLKAYWAHIIILFVGAWLGTLIGTKILKRVSDERFKVVLKWVLTFLAARLIIINVTTLLHNV